MDSKKVFAAFARVISRLAGQPLAFIIACIFLILWAITGPFFEYSNAWQLVINTLTTIITFLMVFVIQNTQNRDGEAIQIKLDELIRANAKAHKSLLDLEELTDQQLAEIKLRYEQLAESARVDLAKGKKDTRSKEV